MSEEKSVGQLNKVINEGEKGRDRGQGWEGSYALKQNTENKQRPFPDSSQDCWGHGRMLGNVNEQNSTTTASWGGAMFLMARAKIALTEYLSSVPRSHTWWFKTVCNSSRETSPLWHSAGTCILIVHPPYIHTYTKFKTNLEKHPLLCKLHNIPLNLMDFCGLIHNWWIYLLCPHVCVKMNLDAAQLLCGCLALLHLLPITPSKERMTKRRTVKQNYL